MAESDATARQIVSLSLGRTALRVLLSNAFGIAALHFTSAHIAPPLSPPVAAIDPARRIALSPAASFSAGNSFSLRQVTATCAPFSKNTRLKARQARRRHLQPVRPFRKNLNSSVDLRSVSPLYPMGRAKSC
jgi:hypothetical protein